MARPLKLKPYKDAQSGKWCVNVIGALSSSGRRERRYFNTLGAATAFTEELKCRRDNTAALPQLSIAQLLDAASALEVLGEDGSTLTEAIRKWLPLRKIQGRSITLEELFRQWTERHAQKSASYRRDIRWSQRILEPLSGYLLSDIARSHIVSLVNPLPAASRNVILRSARAMFNWAKDLEYLVEVPIRPSDFAESPKNEIHILEVPKIRVLLETVWEMEPLLLPLLLVETFTGIRPEEAIRLGWNDISLPRSRVTLRTAITKTVSAREIELAPCALAWFGLYLSSGYPHSGPLLPFSQSTLTRRLRKVRAALGYKTPENPWIEGSLRDAYGSYHLAHFGSVDKLTLSMGHASLQTTRDHYLGLVTSEAAAEFWNLYPPNHRANVVQFATG